VSASDILLRQGIRKATGQLTSSIPRLPFLPDPYTLPVPLLLPSLSAAAAASNFADNETPNAEKKMKTEVEAAAEKASSSPSVVSTEPQPQTPQQRFSLAPALVTPKDFVDTAAPKLSREEELYALSLADLAQQTLGPDAAALVRGDAFAEPSAAPRLLITLAASGGQLSPDLQDALRSVAPTLMAGVDAVEGSGSVGDVGTAVAELDESERANLSAFVQAVVSGVWERLAGRVAPLAAAAAVSGGRQ